VTLSLYFQQDPLKNGVFLSFVKFLAASSEFVREVGNVVCWRGGGGGITHKLKKEALKPGTLPRDKKI
jgi:hypothetical protein